MKKMLYAVIISALISFAGCDDIIFEEYEQPAESTVSSTEIKTEETTFAGTEITTEITTEETTEQQEIFNDYDDNIDAEYHFRTIKQLEQHFEKHGGEFESDFDYETAEEYEAGANDVINNPSSLYKTEKEDGDSVYYLEETNEFVIVSTDGYIRTYFRPTAGIDYFNRQ